MKVEFELNLDSNGRPCIKFRHHDKEQLELLGNKNVEIEYQKIY